MRYLILILYIVLFDYIQDLCGYEVNIAIIGGIIRGVGASRDAKKLQKRADALNPVRPEYQTPEEAERMLEVAYNQAQGDMPGMGRATNEAQGATANFLNRARGVAGTGTGLLQAVSQADVNERRQVNDLNVQNQGFKASNMGRFQDALMRMTDQRNLEFDTNEMQPYLQEESDKRQFQEAAWNQKQAAREGWSSFFDGLIDVGVTALSAPMGTSGQSKFGQMFSKKPVDRQKIEPITAPPRTLPGLIMPTVGINQ